MRNPYLVLASRSGKYPCQIDPERSGPDGHWRVYVAVADADAGCARTQELGGTVDIAPFDIENVGRPAFIRDPAGVRVGLIQQLPG